MEFKKMPGQAATVSTAAPEEQMQQALRLMAQRSMHGARGILLLSGSLLLVFAGASLGYEPVDANGVKSGYKIWDHLAAGIMGMDEWMAVGDLALGLITILCGAIVTRSPRLASLLPAVLFGLKVIAMIMIAATTRTTPGLVLPVFQLALVGFTLRAFADARNYSRDAAAARAYYRSMAVMRQKEARELLAPSDVPLEKRAGTKLPPPKSRSSAETPPQPT